MVVSDNRPQICAKYFAAFATEQDFKHREDCAYHEEHQGLGEGIWQQPTGLLHQASE